MLLLSDQILLLRVLIPTRLPHHRGWVTCWVADREGPPHLYPNCLWIFLLLC